MADQITEPSANGATFDDWRAFIARTTRQSKGMNQIGLTSMNTDIKPRVQLGSIFEMGGVFFEVTNANDDIIDESFIGVGPGHPDGNEYFIYAIPQGNGCFFQYRKTRPEWNGFLGGYYILGGSGSNFWAYRAVAKVFILYGYDINGWNNKVILDVFGSIERANIFQTFQTWYSGIILFDSTATVPPGFEGTNSAGEIYLEVDPGFYMAEVRGGTCGRGQSHPSQIITKRFIWNRNGMRLRVGANAIARPSTEHPAYGSSFGTQYSAGETSLCGDINAPGRPATGSLDIGPAFWLNPIGTTSGYIKLWRFG
jgi:hypothetical protein